MTAYDDAIVEAAEPATSAERLAELAQYYPETHALIAAHPNAYPGLLEWIAEVAAAQPAYSPQPADATSVFAEPAVAEPFQSAPVQTGPRTGIRPGKWIPIAAAALVVVLGATAGIVAVASGAESERTAALQAEQEQQEQQDADAEAAADEQRRLDEEEAAEIAAAEAAAEEEAAAAAAAEQAALEAQSQTLGAWQFASQSGFTYTLGFAVGKPVRAAATVTHPRDSSYTVGSSCSIDPATDVVIPVTITATATTAGYETPISARFTLNSGGRKYTGTGVAPFRGDDRVSVEQNYSSGAVCREMSSDNLWGYGQPEAPNVSWETPTAQGSSVSSNMFIIVRDYYLPVHPDGDTALLDYISINPLFGGNNADTANVYNEVKTGFSTTYSPTVLTLSGNLIGL